MENALKLTQRDKDGTVSRWGLAAHSFHIWWALWQNEAEIVGPLTSQCRLLELPATEAIEFVRGLIHTHRVSPPGWDWPMPPAMVYRPGPLGPPHDNYRAAELPQASARRAGRYRPRVAILDSRQADRLTGAQGPRGNYTTACLLSLRKRCGGRLGQFTVGPPRRKSGIRSPWNTTCGTTGRARIVPVPASWRRSCAATACLRVN